MVRSLVLRQSHFHLGSLTDEPCQSRTHRVADDLQFVDADRGQGDRRIQNPGPGGLSFDGVGRPFTQWKEQHLPAFSLPAHASPYQ